MPATLWTRRLRNCQLLQAHNPTSSHHKTPDRGERSDRGPLCEGPGSGGLFAFACAVDPKSLCHAHICVEKTPEKKQKHTQKIK